MALPLVWRKRLRKTVYLLSTIAIAGAVVWKIRAPEPAPSLRACTPGKHGECLPAQLCLHPIESPVPAPSGTPAYCGVRPLAKTAQVLFPFKTDHSVTCTSGPLSPPRHLHIHTADALTLASSKGVTGIVHAPIEGVAILYDRCKSGSPENCGGGLGNQIRILNSETGEMALLARLGEITIKEGARLSAGQAIGKEGPTGIEFSMHVVPADAWGDLWEKLRHNPGYAPPSIPFETLFCDTSKKGPDCHRQRRRHDQIPCGPSAAPLRGDWDEFQQEPEES